MDEYEAFYSRGNGTVWMTGYRRIHVFFVYAVKHDLRHRARLVAGGHMTPDQGNSYSSVISLRAMRIAMFVGELNGLNIQDM